MSSPGGLDTATMLATQVALLEAGDVDALVRRYHPEAVIIHRGGEVVGREAIRELFSGPAAGPRHILSANTVHAGTDTLLYDVVQESGGQTVRIVGTIVLLDGLVWRHVSIDVPLDS